MIRNPWFLLRYAVAGALGGTVQTASLYIWVTLLDLSSLYLSGVVFSFVVAVLVTFLLQKYWTFRDSDVSRSRSQFVAYAFVAFINLGITLVLSEVSRRLFLENDVPYFEGWYIVVQVAVVGIAAIASFTLNYLFTFRAVTKPVSRPE